LILLLLFNLALASQEKLPDTYVEEVKFLGLQRTDEDWLRNQLDFQLPRTFLASELEFLRNRLLTYSIFTRVDLRADGKTLIIDVSEKWTLIPVIRGAYGGGTPLRVFGVYDIHSFGRRLTLGAEGRKYGDAPWSTVGFLRAPYLARGRVNAGLELWRDHRIQDLYDEDLNEIGEITYDQVRTKGRIAFGSRRAHTKYGLDFELVKGRSDDSEGPSELGRCTDGWCGLILPTVIFDNVIIDNVSMDGLRAIARWGLIQESAGSFAEFETYYYQPLGFDLELALHGFARKSSTATTETVVFLGGFDSVRGFPDGAAFGNEAGFANAELRWLAAKFEYVWLQFGPFADFGAAKLGESDFRRLASAGFGLRLAIPQVYRLVFRLDYGWSLAGKRSQGISAGMNQFFDPYRPL
jgi:outer membrane protein assembly factor BamA